MQKRFRKVDSLEEVLDLPEGWKAEKAGDPNLPQEWNIKQKWTPLFKQRQYTTPTTNVQKNYQYFKNLIYSLSKLQMLLCYLLCINTQGQTTNY